jgi:hypothetical protein
MANESVTISACASNPVLSLSYLIKAALEEAIERPLVKQSEEFHAHYRGQFSLVVGLSLTALLARGGQKHSCKKYFGNFFSCSDDFTRCTEEFDRISLLVAEVVCKSISAFQFLGLPRYFDDLIQAVISVINPVSMESLQKRGDIEKLLQKLFEACQ